MSDHQLNLARMLAERDGPFLFFDSGRGEGESHVFSKPVAVFDGDAADLRAWMGEQIERGLTVAGVLGFELAWKLDSVRARRPATTFPDAWVAAFDGPDDDTSTTFELETRASVAGAFEKPPSFDIERTEYERRVRDAVAAIHAGELFEVNYTERLRGTWSGSAFSLYESMRSSSTGSFFGFAQFDGFSVASVSPEEFLRVDGRKIVTRPIKGTRRRGDTPADDRAARRELLASEKDRAENVMIVDLMRNDLTRWCTPGTVRATQICTVESFAGWHHLVSTVEGELDEGVRPTDVLLGSFPPGSITGAPKLRSIELIAELESSARGPYTGTMFFADRARLRSNVLIRTASLLDGAAEYGAGGAVVADSDPAAEYDEAVLKARPFFELPTDGAGDGS